MCLEYRESRRALDLENSLVRGGILLITNGKQVRTLCTRIFLIQLPIREYIFFAPSFLRKQLVDSQKWVFPHIGMPAIF